jgi:lipoprotein-anchoring transpeptidase ErfK/SrfK
MTSAVRTAASSYLLAARAGVVASGFICAAVYAAPAQAQGSYYPQGRYYSSNSYFNSSRLPTSRSYDRDYDTPRVDRLKAKTAELLKKAPVPPAPKGPLMVVVSIAKQSLTLYDEGMPIAHSKVSTGMAGHSTPTGVFAVIQKSRWHRSNLYSDAPMPFMQRITWSGVALHAGLLPGYPASHGCIRLPEDFAVRMWRTTQMGARVIIVQQDVTPAEIAHPVLFVRKGKPAVMPPAEAPSAAIGLRPTVDAAKANAAAAAMAAVKPAEATATETEKADTAHIKIAEVTSVSTASGEHGPDTANVANDQPATTQGVAKAPAEATEQRVASADDKSAVVATVEPSITKPTAAEPSLESIMAQMPPPAAQAPSLVAPPAPAVMPPAPTVMAGRMLRPGAVSVFVSRKERRLYVRKGFEPLFDMPVTIRNADQAIGTHVFTALAEAPDSLAMRWNVVSVVPAPQAHTPERRAELDVKLAARDKGKKGEKEVISDASPVPQSTASAKEALDRLELPADAVMRISELMSSGASLIVTDEGLGPETGLETDFVVLTKDKEAAPKPKKRAKYID